MSAYRPATRTSARATARPRAATSRQSQARRATRGRRDSDALVVTILTIMATLIAVYDLALLAFSAN